MVLRTKRGKDNEIIKYKARWVVKGFRQIEGVNFDQTYAGVCKNTTWKLAIALAAKLDLEIHQMDVVGAFLNADADTDIFVQVPPDWNDFRADLANVDKSQSKVEMTEPLDWCCKLLKALYGLKQAPRLWQKNLSNALRQLDFEYCASDQCAYINKRTQILIITYVDDMLIIGPDIAEVKVLKTKLANRYDMEDLGEAAYFLGVRITRNRAEGTITLCQDAYVTKILARYGMEDCHIVDSPMAAGAAEFMVPYEGSASVRTIKSYGSKIGSLMYLAVQTRADITYETSTLSRFLSNPSPQHVKAADRVLCYLRGTKHRAIQYSRFQREQALSTALKGYCDSDFAGDKEGRKSVSGVVYIFAGGAISHSSNRQATVAQSSTEAEYYALSKAVSEGLWVRQILSQMMYTGDDLDQIQLYGDNQGALALGENPTLHQRTKHIDVKHHFLREHIESGTIQLNYLQTDRMVADGLTKPLTPALHARFVKQLGLVDLLRK